MTPVRVLFVCLGNICRSPLAEAVVRDRAEKRGMEGMFHFESAGTGSWHVGHGADPRSAETADKYGLDLSRHRAQQITRARVSNWDWYVAMDGDNHDDLIDMGVPQERLLLMRQFEQGDGAVPDVPDPYYGGPDGFDKAYHMLCENADRLLDYLEKQVL